MGVEPTTLWSIVKDPIQYTTDRPSTSSSILTVYFYFYSVIVTEITFQCESVMFASLQGSYLQKKMSNGFCFNVKFYEF